jgi:hypothetical protein
MGLARLGMALLAFSAPNIMNFVRSRDFGNNHRAMMDQTQVCEGISAEILNLASLLDCAVPGRRK